MVTIVPAILEETRENLENKIFQVCAISGVERVQVDFADGQFVPHKTVSIGEFPTLNATFHWEAHLMVKAPANFSDYQKAGFKTVVVHYEAFDDEELIDSAIAEIKKLGLEPALAINPETPVSALKSFSDSINQFLILSIHPGFQGHSFVPESVGRVSELRKLVPNAIIEVDGGIKASNAPLLASAGADLLVVGSALYETEDVTANFEKIQQAIINIK